MANIFHELDDPKPILAEIRRILKNNGYLYLIDWQPIETPVGPPIEHRLPEQTVIETVENAGFTIEQSWKIFPFHYVLSFLNRK